MVHSPGVYTIGRESPTSHSEIQIPSGAPGQNSVSHDHLEVVITPNGVYHVTDLDSANGTFVFEDSGWMPIEHCAINPDAPLRLGAYQTTLRQLIHLADPPPDLPPVVHDQHVEPHRDHVGTVMVRCTCGAVKERGGSCRHCGPNSEAPFVPAKQRVP